MSVELVPSDVAILDLLRSREALTVAELATAMGVTATAVRQRLGRLMAQGHIERRAERSDGGRAERGRPRHLYSLTDQGRRQTGANFADLAICLWEEIRQIDDAQVRRGLLRRIARRLAVAYADHVEGGTVEEKMQSLCDLFRERSVPFEIDRTNELPVLTALACPYPELAEKDRTICSVERMVFSELLGENVRLSQCRLDGETCCTFEAH